MNKGFVYSDLFQLLPQSEKVSKLDFVEGGRTPAYSSDTSNNGCLGFVDKEPLFVISDDRPVYLVFGDHTKTMNIVHNDFCVMDNVKVLVPKISMSDEILLYVTTAWKKAIPNLGYARHWSKAQEVLIQLPVIENVNPNHEYTVDDIDWGYMRDRITELERDRITELERDRITELDAYLQATGLNDYELTEEDKKILSLSAKRASDENGTLEDNSKDEVRFGKFVIGEIFKSQNGDTDLQKTDVNGKGVPIITSGVQNNGILGLSDREAKVINANTITVDMFGNAYFRDFAYKMVTHARVFSLELKEGALSDGAGLYICSKLKHFSELFSYNNMCSFNKIKSLSIELPIKLDGTPDFEYMERYIRAMENVVIVDVVKYKDKVIETMNKVV